MPSFSTDYAAPGLGLVHASSASGLGLVSSIRLAFVLYCLCSSDYLVLYSGLVSAIVLSGLVLSSGLVCAVPYASVAETFVTAKGSTAQV